MRVLAVPAILVFGALLPGVANVAAQERPPVERQGLIDLAFVLGEAHALRQTCEGPNDQYWRQRMVKLTEIERADQAFDAQLRDRFNTGFAAAQAQHATCDAATRAAEARAAARGQALAARMSTVMRPATPADPSATGLPQ